MENYGIEDSKSCFLEFLNAYLSRLTDPATSQIIQFSMTTVIADEICLYILKHDVLYIVA